MQDRSVAHEVTFFVGMMIGLAIALTTVVIFIARLTPDFRSSPQFFAPFPMYRYVERANASCTLITSRSIHHFRDVTCLDGAR